jgi:putative acetyltransferase
VTAKGLSLRPVAPGDHAAIRAPVDAAFAASPMGLSGEGALVEALRTEGAVVVERVASIDGRLVGHVLFSQLEAGEGPPLAALAPVSVAPAMQGGGIGGAMILDGLAELRARGFGGAVVLGHPGYYPRFGFSAERARSLTAPFGGPSFMALAFVGGALEGRAVRYARAFGLEGMAA